MTRKTSSIIQFMNGQKMPHFSRQLESEILVFDSKLYRKGQNVNKKLSNLEIKVLYEEWIRKQKEKFRMWCDLMIDNNFNTTESDSPAYISEEIEVWADGECIESHPVILRNTCSEMNHVGGWKLLECFAVKLDILYHDDYAYNVNESTIMLRFSDWVNHNEDNWFYQ